MIVEYRGDAISEEDLKSAVTNFCIRMNICC